MFRGARKNGWTARTDFREICDCQRHRRERVWWRRSLRAAQQRIGRGGLALLVGVPLAFGAVMPGESFGKHSAIARRVAQKVEDETKRALPIFTTEQIRSTFLNRNSEPQAFSLEISKEAFFRTQVPYGAIIYSEARKNNLAPELVAAVVESESDFRATLISNKNAKGLMQIVPETGRLMGCENPFDPQANVAAGTKYLRYLIDRFGDQRLALAAYNAGEGNIERFGGIPPFTETTNYLARVAQRTRLYRERVRGGFIAQLRFRTSVAQ
jgi:soluble lytic murein transglycosylase-like protein